MMSIADCYRKASRKLMKLRLQPIRVFCFHQVSDVFDPQTMMECDWTQTEAFKNKILALERKYAFISLDEAYRHIANDKFRIKDYAVLTADDGWASLKNILPWLVEKKIPLTLFLNPLYLDGNHYRKHETEKYLSVKEIGRITESNNEISIASHGWSHVDSTKLPKDSFEESMIKAEEFLKSMKGKIPFFAFTYGRYTKEQLILIRQHSLVPVLVDGMMNYSDTSCIHRECIDEGRKE